jgi:hypothetical protein
VPLFGLAAEVRIELTIPLDRGPGHYYVVVYAGQGIRSGRPIFPVAAPLVVAE